MLQDPMLFQTDEDKDINWSVNFEVTINGEEVSFDELSENAKRTILDCIANDYYSGTFVD